MTKQTEALKLALEALKTFHYAMIDAGVLDRQEVLNQGFTAATAIREALAEQPAQQEPVARVINKSIVWRPCDIAGLPTGSPLYTSPPASKPWVGLTDEELRACTQSPFVMENYRAVEAKLKEKNT